MKPSQFSLLLHPVFLASLALLLVNDHYWKYEYHNVLTGKLSDVAGLVILPVFLSSLFPKYRLHAFFLSALLFIWWKSSWSQPVIDMINNQGWNIGRVIDPTDLLALLAMPLAWRIKPTPSGTYSPSPIRPLGIVLSGLFTITSLCATTCTRYLQPDRPIYTSGHFRTRLQEKDIISRFNQHTIALKKDTVFYEKLRNDNLYTPVMDSSGVTKMTKREDIYVRRVPALPSFIIPELVIGADTLNDVRFHVVANGGKSRTIQLASFQYHGQKGRYTYHPEHTLEREFRKPLLNKLKEILK